MPGGPGAPTIRRPVGRHGRPGDLGKGVDALKKIVVRKSGAVRLTMRAVYCYGCCCCSVTR